MEFTLSVSSFHTPLTFFTCACPPSFPSLPTSRATRVTSCVNTLNCAIIVFTILALRKNSPSSGRPSASKLTVWLKSPLATALIERVTSEIGQTRSPIKLFTESSMPRQAPLLPILNDARCRILPSLPTARVTRRSSFSIVALVSIISLNVSASLPSTPVQLLGRRTEKSPARAASIAFNSSETSHCDEPLRSRRRLEFAAGREVAAPLSISATLWGCCVFIVCSSMGEVRTA